MLVGAAYRKSGYLARFLRDVGLHRPIVAIFEFFLPRASGNALNLHLYARDHPIHGLYQSRGRQPSPHCLPGTQSPALHRAGTEAEPPSHALSPTTSKPT
jgi:hypothetical protein